MATGRFVVSRRMQVILEACLDTTGLCPPLCVAPDDVLCLQVKLEEALTLATDFHNSLQDFINWLTQGEQTLNMVSPASLILDTIMFQIDEHKVKFV